MEKLQSVKEFEKCVECGSEDTAEYTEIERFPYGEPAVELECYVSVIECRNCRFKWTDYRAEESRDLTVLRYLVQDAKNPRGAMLSILGNMKLWALDIDVVRKIEQVIEHVKQLD